MSGKIPSNKLPKQLNLDVREIDETIVSLSNLGFFCESQYFKQGLPFSLDRCLLRETAAKRLLCAQYLLPYGYKFKIYDAYRPKELQQVLWERYRSEIAKEYPNISEEEIDTKTMVFVSKPSKDINTPHNTGGAIDLTIIDAKGQELDMGTGFDDFSEKAWTDYFELYDIDFEVRKNRRMLYNAMINAGFTNLPSEWWHYDFGTSNWAYYKNTDIIYGAMQTSEVLINAK